MTTRQVILLDHDPNWTIDYQREATKISSVWGAHLLDIQHAGSTSIPGIQAKPIIDILAVVDNLRVPDETTEAMAALGYIARGEYGIPGRRYFVRALPDGTHTHHLHAFAGGNPEIVRMLVFRDYLRAHPAEAQAYQRVKQDLARQFRFDLAAYTEGKSDFIEAILRKASSE